jgi:hypothetical protein
MFVKRRKLLAAFSLLTGFIVVMTISHYLYLDDTHVENGKAARAAVIGEAAPPAAPVRVFAREEWAPKVEMSLDEEIKLARTISKVEFVPGKKSHPVMVSAASDPMKEDISDPITDDGVPELSEDGTRYIPRRRVVHLDLKGAPPKISYLKTLFPLFKSAGATSVLIEYEDMFPFSGELKNLSALNAYTLAEVDLILGFAKASDLEVIPLVQTFGHMEMALKLEEFRELRETPPHPQDICPSREGTWDLITLIIDQVSALHPDSQFLHIGCDEVFHLAQCPICMGRVTRANEDPKATRDV